MSQPISVQDSKEKRYNELQSLEKWRKDNTPAPGE